MCDNRLKIGKQLQKSVVEGSIIKTDANNEQVYVAPGTVGQILTIVGGVPTWSDPAAIPPSATLVDNGDGTFTYTDGATSFVIDTTDRLLSSVVYNPATQDFTYTWSNGDVTVVDLTSLLNVYNLVSGSNTTVTGDGLSTAWQVNGYGVTNNGDGTYNVTTPTGVGNFTIDTNETVTNIVGNNYVNEDGVSQPIVQTVVNTLNASGDLVTTVNGIQSVPLALPDDIVTNLTASLDTTNPLAPTLVITYINEDGSNGVQNVSLAPLLDNTNTTYVLADNADGTISLIGSDSTDVVIDVCAIVAANCPTVLTSTDGSVTVNGLDLSVAHVLNPDGSITLNDGTIIPAPIVASPSTVTNTITGNRIATHTSGGGTVVDINESVTSFAAITDGYQFTSEDGTVYPFTFLFDNSTPSAPQLLVQLNGVTQSAIPLNSYDVNIATAGGFVLNPLTDEITITETDGETHVIDLSYLRSTLTSTDGSVALVTSANPDGSTNYDLAVTHVLNPDGSITLNDGTIVAAPFIHTPSTFSQDPLTGVITHNNGSGTTNIANVVSSDANNDIIVSSDGGAYLNIGIPNTHIVATTAYDALNPLTGWTAPINPIAGNTVEVLFTDGTVGNYTFDGTVWGLDFATSPIVPIPATLTTVVGGAGLPNTATFDNGVDTPTVFNYIEGARNNLQLGSPIVERGNVNAGGSQPADFIRDIYNWLGGSFKDHWQSAGDAELFSIKANQSINAANTTNSGAGAVNIGTVGAGGQYKLNVGGAIWLDNGRNSQFIGNQAGQNSTSNNSVAIGREAFRNNSNNEQVFIGSLAGANNTVSLQSNSIGYSSMRLSTSLFTNAFGWKSGENSEGKQNDYFGHESGRNNKGSNVQSIGLYSARNNTGSAVIGVGVSSVENNNKNNVIGIGNNAARNNSGTIVNAIGVECAENNTGNDVYILGHQAAINNTGSFVFGMGRNAVANNTGSEVVAIGGFGTGSSNIGDNVILMGTLAGANNSGSNSIGIGVQSSQFNTGDNVASLGFSSLRNNTGDNVIAIGRDAGLVNTQSNRVILGFNELPQFANAAAAAAAMPAASANGVYIYWDLSDNTIKVRP